MPSACRRACTVAAVARELLVRKATPRPAASRAASVSPAPGFNVLPCHTQPSRSNTKPRTSRSDTAGTTLIGVGGALELRDRLRVDLLGLLRHARPAELLFHAPAARLAHARTQLRIVEHAPERLRERLRLRGGDE